MPWSNGDSVPANIRMAARTYYVVVFVLGVILIVLSGAMAMYAINTPRPMPELPAAPIAYAQEEFLPIQHDLCPGGTLEFDVVRTVRRATTVSSQGTWYYVPESRGVVIETPVPPRGTVPAVETIHRQIPLPREVAAPGDYQYRLTLWEGTPSERQSKVAQYIVRFSIRPDCGD